LGCHWGLGTSASDMGAYGGAQVVAAPHTVHVPGDYSSIQEAILMSWDGDTVLVHPGTYLENIQFICRNFILASLYLITSDTAYISSTIIDGDNTGSVISIVRNQSRLSRISGFTIRHGNATGQYGGGINCRGADPIIDHCIIRDNHARYGAGISAIESNIEIQSCSIVGNSAAGADPQGGAIYFGGTNNFPRIKYCTIWGNVATGWGAQAGAIYVNYSNISIENCTISGNDAIGFRSRGGGLYFRDQSNTSIINTILWADSAYEGSEIFNSNSILSVHFCDIQGGWPGTGNIDVDPFFRDPSAADYHLQSTACSDSADSPCIDAGWPDLSDSLLDCAWGLGTLRSDIGAYGGGGNITGIGDEREDIPSIPFLISNYPNPFNAQTTIRFYLPKPAQVELTIFDILGRRIEGLIDGDLEAGPHRIIWDAGEWPSGLYFYVLNSGGRILAGKMTLLK